MAIDSYASLTSSINSWSERSYDASLTDDFISLAEAQFNTLLGPAYRRSVTATVTTNSAGVAALPSGFVLMRSFTRDLLGSVPLKQISWEALTALNPYANASDPTWFAISGTSLKVAPIVEDDFVAVYDARLVGLSGANPSNWLLEIAPHAYLFMALAFEKAFREDFAGAQGMEAKATQMIAEIVEQSVVAQFGNVESVPNTVMP